MVGGFAFCYLHFVICTFLVGTRKIFYSEQVEKVHFNKKAKEH